MKLMVTGGCGFIGSTFIKLALKKGFKVINIDSLTYAAHKMKENFNNKNHFFIKCDIGDNRKIRKILKKHKPVSIINFASETHVDRSIHNPDVFFQTNVLKTFKLVEETRKFISINNLKNFRFIHISTDEVYGSLKKREPSFSEKNKFFPNSPYSASKASAEHIMRSYFKTFKFPVIISNCSNNYGPYQYPEKLIPLIIQNAILKKKLPVYGDGKQVRDWLFVDDHCLAIFTILKKGKIGETYNIGGNNELSNIFLIKKICSYLDQKFNKKVKDSFSKQMTFVSDRPGHDRRYSINSSKITKKLKWRPKYNFTKGIKFTIEWYLENNDWINMIKSDQKKWMKKNYYNRTDLIK